MIDGPLSLREHAPGEAEVSAQEPIVVRRFHGQIVLQRRVLDGAGSGVARFGAEIMRDPFTTRASDLEVLA